ncbi:MAG TPA: hypothetical protein VFG58_07550 [Solirubrobacterales bacterium]|nr:hypothetical protein [Solirubrobacterales bacterium]
MRNEAEHSDVVALAIRSSRDPSRVLLGVRTSLPTSPRHPNVLSTPTMRVPESVMTAALSEVLADAPPLLEPGEIRSLDSAHEVRIGGARSQTELLAFLSETLLARKLGMAASLAGGELAGSATAAVLALDEVLDPASPDGAPELTRMLTIQLSLDSGAGAFPQSTDHYSGLHWIEASKLPAAVDSNHPVSLVPDIDLNVCIHGLCVRSAAAHFEESPTR